MDSRSLSTDEDSLPIFEVVSVGVVTCQPIVEIRWYSLE